MNDCDDIEYVCVMLKAKNYKNFIYCLYIVPIVDSRNYIERYRKHIDAINTIPIEESDIVYVVGDFNLPRITWMENDEQPNNYLPINVTTDIETLVIDTLFGMGLYQTNGMTNSMNRLLDLVFTNDGNTTGVLRSESSISKIDPYHPPLEMIIELCDLVPAQHNAGVKFNFHRADYVALNQYFASVDFATNLEELDTDAAVDFLYDVLHQGFELHVPHSLVRPNNHPPWHNKTLAAIKNRKNKAHRRYTATRSPTDYETLCGIRSE